MNQQNHEHLFSKYSGLFDDSDDAPIREWGIEVQDGWYSIIEGMCRDLYDRRSEDPDTFPRIRQVKSKFGGLVVYMSEQDAPVELILDAAVTACQHTCETCGSYGVLRRTKRRWYFVACDQHAGDSEIVPVKQ